MSITELKKPNISHYLGIDYGKSKVGLAMADSETRMAFAYATLENDKNLLQKLAEIVEKENISKIIIGVASYINREEVYPVKSRGAGAPSAQFNRASPGEKLGNFLKDKLRIDVEYQDEMFTTREAQRNLIEKGVKGIKRYDDQEAARIILQGWLDSKT